MEKMFKGRHKRRLKIEKEKRHFLTGTPLKEWHFIQPHTNKKAFWHKFMFCRKKWHLLAFFKEIIYFYTTATRLNKFVVYFKGRIFFSFQKEMFSSKADGGASMGAGAQPVGSNKNKWVKAFKSIKGKNDAPVDNGRYVTKQMHFSFRKKK